MRIGSIMASGLLVLAVASQVQAGVIRDDRDDSLYLTLGADPKYQSVGQFSWSDSQSNYFASGVVIQTAGSSWVLTAGHVLDTTAARTFTINGTAYSVAQSVVYPNWSGNLNQGYDIALARLDGTPSVTPAARYTGTAEVGKVGTFVGYGMTGTGLTGATTFDSQKRAGTNTIDVLYRTTNATRMFGVDFDSPSGSGNVYGSSTALDLEYLTSFGDSGGGVFIDVGGQTLLAGITSWGADYNGNGLDDDYGDVGGYTRVSSFNSWIDSVVGGGTGGGGGGGGTGGGKGGGNGHGHDLALPGAAAVPEPASLAILTCGTLGLLARRRQRRN